MSDLCSAFGRRLETIEQIGQRLSFNRADFLFLPRIFNHFASAVDASDAEEIVVKFRSWARQIRSVNDEQKKFEVCILRHHIPDILRYIGVIRKSRSWKHNAQTFWR
jgi:hypothetical protein